MINYESVDSPFYAANKNYFEAIENKLKNINLNCSGFCNSYGYEIETSFLKNNSTYNIKFLKFQSTQNGVVLPVDAHDYTGTELSITGLNKKIMIVVGKSAWIRFFNSKKYKKYLPTPFYIKFSYTPGESFLEIFSKKILTNNISTLKVSKGTLNCKIHMAAADPISLITDMEMIINNRNTSLNIT